MRIRDFDPPKELVRFIEAGSCYPFGIQAQLGNYEINFFIVKTRGLIFDDVTHFVFQSAFFSLEERKSL